jgi:hypothetical protein
VKGYADAKTNLVLARVLHDGDDLLSVLLGELSRPLREGDVGLLQHNVGVTPTNTLDSRL